jgi:hypothetical protein
MEIELYKEMITMWNKNQATLFTSGQKTGFMEVNKMEKKIEPKARIKCGTLSLSVWENKGKKDDKQYSFNTFTFQKGYKDDKGEWQNTQNLNSADLLVLSELLKIAHEKFNVTAEDVR